LSHTSSHFALVIFGDEVSQTTCLNWPQTTILLISASQVVGIAGVSHWPLGAVSQIFVSRFDLSSPCTSNVNIQSSNQGCPVAISNLTRAKWVHSFISLPFPHKSFSPRNLAQSVVPQFLQFLSFFFFFLLGFELRTSYLLGRWSVTWATPPAFLMLVIF
jgi:hypothetical protein